METTSSLLKSVTKRVWSNRQRPFKVCSRDRETRKGVTAGSLEELQERAVQVLWLSTSSVTLVCEEDGTGVDSDEFLAFLPDNTLLMALEPGEAWKPHPLSKPLPRIFSKSDSKPRGGQDIAKVTFDLYRQSPKDLFGSLNVIATFQGLYSISADFQCLGPKKIIREALRMVSTLLQAAGQLLIASSSLIRRVIHGVELMQSEQRSEQLEYWN